jgi:polar amino acid transport system substrate-binding protein
VKLQPLLPTLSVSLTIRYPVPGSAIISRHRQDVIDPTEQTSDQRGTSRAAHEVIVREEFGGVKGQRQYRPLIEVGTEARKVLKPHPLQGAREASTSPDPGGDNMQARRVAPLLLTLGLVIAACTGPGASPSGTGMAASPSAPVADIPNIVCVGEATTYQEWLEGVFEPDEQDPIEEPADTAGDLLETIRQRGTLRISTDADYAPQSFLEPDGTFVGFDVDVGTEIAERLGVEAEFQHVDWDIVTAGSWQERWDISVGSMTITTPRKEAFSFTQPYYFTPAVLAVTEDSGVTSLDQLPFELPEGAEVTTRNTDAVCAEEIQAGREEFALWMSSETTVDEAIATGIPLVKIGEPAFSENLSVAIDKAGPDHDALLFEIDKIIGEMHADGTLTELSQEWFEGEDLTQDPTAS